MWCDPVNLIFFILIFSLSLIICTVILRASKFNYVSTSKYSKCHGPTLDVGSLNIDWHCQNRKVEDVREVGGDKSGKT